MNTKGIKFLAVLAIMAMAFAAVIALAPADNNLDAVNVYDDNVVRDPTVISATQTKTLFYISEDASVKVTGLANDITIYVQNGKELELNIKCTEDQLAKKITVYSVTSDQQRITTSTVDSAVCGTNNTGKFILDKTELTFNGVRGQTVVYKAMMPSYVDTHTTTVSGKVLDTHIWTTDFFGDQCYATISSDKIITGSSAANAVIGQHVTIASGQFVEVASTVTVNTTAYGVYVVDAPALQNGATTYVYYAVGADAGTLTIDTASDLVKVLNGSASVKDGTASAKAASVKSVAGVTLKRAAENKIDVAGTIKEGTVTVSGAVKFSTVVIDADAAVIVNNNTTVDSSSSVTVTGKLYLKTDKEKITGATFTGTGIIYAQNPKLWDYAPQQGADPIPFIISNDESFGFNGLIDTTAINETAKVTDRFASAVIERNQTFRVVGDVVVTTALTVQGVLIIDEGASVTISKSQNNGAVITLTGQYGQIINNGKLNIQVTSNSAQTRDYGLHMEGGYAENNGLITANSDVNAVKDGKNTLAFEFPDGSRGIGFVNNGTITVGPNDTAKFADNKFFNNGSITVNGKIAAGAFTNAGLFTFNNAQIVGAMTVTLDEFASLNIVAAQISNASGAGITVQNAADYGDRVVVTAGPAASSTAEFFTIRGLTITDLSIPYVAHNLDLAGSMGVNKAGTTDGYALLTLTGNISVSTSAIIGERVAMANNGTVNLSVAGDLTFSKKNAIISGTTPNPGPDNFTAILKSVTGKIVDLDSRLNTSQFLCARYVLPTDGTTIYAPLEDAIPAADAANVHSVDVGKIDATADSAEKYPTLLTDLTIPAGMFVNGYGLTIGDNDNSPVVTVKSASSFNFNNIYLYEGQILADNVNDVNESAIHSDVKVIDPTKYSGNFMSLRVAIEEMPGQTIYLNQDFENISRDLYIPAGTAIVATNEDGNDKYFTMIDSSLVVDGTLIVNEFWFVATTDDTKGITVNGTIMDRHSDGDCFDGWWYMPEGVSYQLTLPDKYGNDETWFVITSLDRLQESIYIADESKVNIEGNPKLGDLTIHGTDDEPAEVTFKGNVNAGTITMDNVIIKALDGKKVTATFADAVGSITITGAYVDRELTIYSLGNTGVFMAGSVTDNETGTYYIRFDGITGIDGTTRAVIGWGAYCESINVVEDDEVIGIVYVTIDEPTILFNGETTAVGKKAVISNTRIDEPVEGMVTITGDLIANNSTKIVMNTDVEVLGGLFAAERTETATAGSIEIYGDLFVGALRSEIYNSEDAVRAYADDNISAYNFDDYGSCLRTYTSGDAVVSGKVSIADYKFITVVAGSEIDDSIVEDLESMDIIIEGELWITVYGSSRYSMDGLKAPIFNAKVDKILDVDGNEIAKYSNKYKVIYGCGYLDLGDTGLVSISLNYEAFTVTIKTDGSVKAVYIDGILMETGMNRNIFSLGKVTAGTHKVTVEAATGYDAAKCVLYTEMGTILPGMSFTFTEYDCELDEDGFNTYNVIYNINGTEIQPEPVPPTPEEESQWTITTILLVILVVLIAIMAVIVALRLNRS